MKPRLAELALAGMVLVAQIALSGCRRSSAEPVQGPAPALTVQVIRPERGPITRFVTLPGQIKAYQQATLYAKVAGYLKTIAIDKGDRVNGGAHVAEIEVPELLADRAKCRAQVEVA